MPDIIAIGEALIDFIPTTPGKGLADTPAFEKRPGGAPANVAVGVSRLNGYSGFIGKLGRDEFGDFLKQTLYQNGVDTEALVYTDEAKTALAFVTLKENGEREFIFYRSPCADILLQPEEIKEEYIKRAKVLHFGTVSLIDNPSAAATYHTVKLARQMGKVISLDVNLREPLWPSLDKAKEEFLNALQLADIVKVSEEELYFATCQQEIDAGAEKLLQMGAELVLVTLGSKGCYIKTTAYSREVPGIKVKPVDTTGAGDAFTAAVLTKLVEAGISNRENIKGISVEKMEHLCKFANAAGALTCTKNGAISALPTLSEVNKSMKNVK
ncbi:MAG: carbohydrate kinase [Firmicutes bacterium]|nr:carbohydrate kinase [Bacillota bacterium]